MGVSGEDLANLNINMEATKAISITG